MTIFFNLLALTFWALGILGWLIAIGAPHQIEALILFLIGTLCAIGAELIHQLKDISSRIYRTDK